MLTVRGSCRAGGHRARFERRRWRISSNCCCACICWVNSVAWMPWKRPSSQPTSCRLRDPELGVARGLARERSVTSLSSRFRSSERMSWSFLDRALVDLLERPAAGVVERREPGLVEQRAHHRRDADQLGRPGDLLALGGVRRPRPDCRRRALRALENFGGHRYAVSRGHGEAW